MGLYSPAGGRGAQRSAGPRPRLRRDVPLRCALRAPPRPPTAQPRPGPGPLNRSSHWSGVRGVGGLRRPGRRARPGVPSGRAGASTATERSRAESGRRAGHGRGLGWLGHPLPLSVSCIVCSIHAGPGTPGVSCVSLARPLGPLIALCRGLRLPLPRGYAVQVSRHRHKTLMCWATTKKTVDIFVSL